MQENPLRIFTSQQLKRISYSSLKELKKEILLEFQFTTESTAKINGHRVDKNTVLLIFDELDLLLLPYLQIENNPKLKSFFRSGNLDFLKDEAANEIFSEIVCAYNTIESNVTGILAEKIFSLCKSHTLESIIEISAWNAFLKLFSQNKTIDPKKQSIHCQKIILINSFIEKFSATNQIKAYGLTYDYLQNRIKESRAIIKKSIDENNSYEFKDGLEAYFNMGFINLFDVLPDHFEGMANTYTHYCKVTYVDPWIDKDLKNLGMYQLGIISAATNTVLKRHPSNKIDSFNDKLDLKYSSSTGCMAYCILFFIVFFTIVAIFLLSS